MKPIITKLLTIAIISFVATTSSYALSINCPGDQWVSCTDELWDLSIYGNATYVDYDGTHDAGQPVEEYFLNMCDIGYITRTWTVYAYGHSATCTQTIYAENNSPFTGNNINWPISGLVLEGCNPNTDPDALPEGYGTPTYNYAACAMIAINYNDEIFTISATCKKLLRTWQVMDWCTYDENTGQGGLWTFTQIIKLVNGDTPEPVVPNDSTYYSSNCENTYVTIPLLIIDPTTCGGTYTVTNNSPYAESNDSNASGLYPIGVTTVKYTIHYGCGNKKYFTTNITVSDNKNPQPYCYQSLTMAMMPIDNDGDGLPEDGMVEVWAKDLDYGSFHSCPNHYPLTISFSEDPTDMVRTFTCAEVGENLIQMWVTDRFGNQDFCNVVLHIQNNAANIPNCQPAAQTTSAWGYVKTVSQEFVTNTEVLLTKTTVKNDNNTPTTEMYMSNNDGFFNFDSLEKHVDYQVSCNKAINLKDYVTKEDVRAIYMHIIGRQLITEPLQLLAADINNDQVIDRDDLYAVYYFANGTNNDLGIQNTHFFIPTEYITDNLAVYYGGEFNNDYIIHDLKEEMKDMDFTMVIKGDIYSEKVNHYLRNGLNEAIDSDIDNYLTSREAKNLSIITPNPFSDIVTIKLDAKPQTDINFAIYNNQGTIMFRETYNTADRLRISLGSKLNAGVYYYNISYGKSNQSGTIIKL